MIHELLAQLNIPAQNILLTAISVLWGATTGMVAIVWRFVVRELRECKKDRKELWETLAVHGIRRPEERKDTNQ